MTSSFTYQALPTRVVFGIGALRRLPGEVAGLGLTRVLVPCSPEQEATGKLVPTHSATAPPVRCPRPAYTSRSKSPTAHGHWPPRSVPTAASPSAAAR